MRDQADNLRRKMSASEKLQEAKTIAVISGKGGVGKSNVALNFSLELIKRGKKVVLFDLDLGMGNIHILLGLQPKYTLIDLFDKRLSIFDIIASGPRNLSYIAGGSGLSEFIQLDEEKKHHFFKQYQIAAEHYDYIIFDMGAGISADSLFFILAADECITVTTGEPTAITDAYSIIKQIIRNGGDMPIRVVLNRAKTKEEYHAVERLQQVVKQFLHVTIYPLGVIPEDKHVLEAVVRQTPYVLLNGNSPASRSIQALAANYLDNNKRMQFNYQPAFLQRLKNFLRGNV